MVWPCGLTQASFGEPCTANCPQPCTTDAGRVVSELYRHILERGPDGGAQHWQQQLANGSMTVRDVVRNLVSQDHGLAVVATTRSSGHDARTTMAAGVVGP